VRIAPGRALARPFERSVAAVTDRSTASL